MHTPIKHLAAGAALAAAALASAPASAIVIFGGTYSQDFNTLANSPGDSVKSWSDDSTLAGWFSVNGSNQSSYVVEDPAINGNFAINVKMSLGVVGNSDRALTNTSNGSGAKPGVELRMVNGTGSSINGLALDYVAEQWFRSDTGAVHFSYSINGGTFTNVALLDAFTPQASSGTRIAIDGNLAANQVAKSDIFSLSTSWGVGDTLVARWSFDNASSLAIGLGIDDLVISAANVGSSVPEPGSLALLGFGLLGLGWGRRKNAA